MAQQNRGVEIKDLGIGALRKQLNELGSLRVLVGIQGDEAAAKHPNADATVGTVAAWNEYGTARAPARPFQDRGRAEFKQRASAAIKKAASDLIDGRARTAVDALEPVGKIGAEAVRDAIDTASSWAEPLADSTKRRKGHDRPLRDSDTVRDAVTYTIRKRGRIIRSGKP